MTEEKKSVLTKKDREDIQYLLADGAVYSALDMMERKVLANCKKELEAEIAELKKQLAQAQKDIELREGSLRNARNLIEMFENQLKEERKKAEEVAEEIVECFGCDCEYFSPCHACRIKEKLHPTKNKKRD